MYSGCMRSKKSKSIRMWAGLCLLLFAAQPAYCGFPKLETSEKKPTFLRFVKHFSDKELNANPGFLTPKSFTTDSNLQKCVNESFVELKQKYGTSFGVALVDLTGEKLQNPQFAEYNSTKSMYGASQSKAAALLAAHQMLFDVRAMVADLYTKQVQNLNHIKAEVIKQLTLGKGGVSLDDKFAFKKAPEGYHVLFLDKFKYEMDQMMRVSNNTMASLVIKKLGFNYINSVMWQLGLYDPGHGGGLWLGRGYGKPAGYWHRDPVGNFSHGINPLAMAKYLTLMTQERLVSPELSRSLKTFLANTKFPIKFVLGLKNLGLKVNKEGLNENDPTKKALVFRKSGSMGQPLPVSHDATLIYRTVCTDNTCGEKKEIRYVATGASKGHATKSMWLIGQKLDQCIRKNNGLP